MTQNKTNFQRLINVLDRQRYAYLTAGILLVVSSVVRMIEPKVLEIAIDGVIKTRGAGLSNTPDSLAQTFYNALPTISPNNLVWVLCCIGFIYIALVAVRSLSQIGAAALAANSTEQAAESLRNRLFEHLQKLPLAWHDKTPSGEIVQRCTGDIDTLRNFLSSQVTEVIRLAAVFGGALWIMCAVNVTYALVSVCLVPVIIILTFIFFTKESKVWEEHENEQDKLTDLIQENLSGIRVVQAFAREKEEIERMEAQNLVKRDVGMKHIYLHQFFWAVTDFLIFAQVLISLIFGAYWVANGTITLGNFVSFTIYSGMVAWPMRQLGQTVSRMGMAMIALQRLYEILDEPIETYADNTPDVRLHGDIVFDNVSFAYQNTSDTALANQRQFMLSNLNIHIKAGEKVALVGPVGSGKSTLIALLTQLYEPSTGEISIDGKPLSAYSKMNLRRRIGVVQQKAFLFSDSIANNLAYTLDDKDVNENLISATKDAAIHDFVQGLPKRYDTQVGEKGVTLSGGQKQRVALARTLLADTDIVILDDATSAVDTETEYHIQNALKHRLKDKTVIIIAHRDSSLQWADRILKLDNGQLVAEK